jgi:5-deoxy-glucuronate isomerase
MHEQLKAVLDVRTRRPQAIAEAAARRKRRAAPLGGVTDFAYAPRDAIVTVSSEAGGVFALPSARCINKLPPRYGPAERVPVELRGAGQASRQVNNFCAPEAFECDKLIAVEVLTPGGNWSSYPPHKHDQRSAHEAELEEIYYFETRGLAYQRVYAPLTAPSTCWPRSRRAMSC